MSDGFQGEVALKHSPTTLRVCEEHVLDEPFPGPSLRWGRIHTLDEPPGHVRGVDPQGVGRSPPVKNLNIRLASADPLWTAAWVRLEIILYVYEALCELVTFAFVASHLFSAVIHLAWLLQPRPSSEGCSEE